MRRQFMCGLLSTTIFFTSDISVSAEGNKWSSGVKATPMADYEPIVLTDDLGVLETASVATYIATALSIVSSLKSIFGGNASEEELKQAFQEINAKLDSLIAGQGKILAELKGLRSGIRDDMRAAFLFDLESDIKGFVYSFEQTSNRFGQVNREERKRMVRELVLLETKVRDKANKIFQYGTGGYMGSVVAFSLLLEVHNLAQRLGGRSIKRELLRKEEAYLVRTGTEWKAFVDPSRRKSFASSKAFYESRIAQLRQEANQTQNSSPHVINKGTEYKSRGRCEYSRNYRDLLYILGSFDTRFHDRVVRDYTEWHEIGCEDPRFDHRPGIDKTLDQEQIILELENNSSRQEFSPQKAIGSKGFLVHGITQNLNDARNKAGRMGEKVRVLNSLIENVSLFVREAEERRRQVTGELED